MSDLALRERLNDLAADAPPGSTAPPQLLRRARRRVVITLTSSVAIALIVLGAGIAGLRIVTDADPRPADPNPIETFEDTFAGVHGWIVYNYPYPSELDAIDPAEPGMIGVPLPPGGGWNASPIGWSRDGTRLLLRRNGGLLVLNADGSETRLAPRYVAGASFSPDGSEVVYGADDSLYLVDVDGGTPRLLIEKETGPSYTRSLSFPAWSPDGSQIAFLDGGGWISVVNPDGSGQREILDLRGVVSPWDLEGLAWSPDGSRLVYSTGEYAGESRPKGSIHVFNADGSGLREIPTEDHASSPTWAPDGSRIAFVCSPRGETYGNLCIVGVDDGDVQRFPQVVLPLDYGLGTVAWNPVG